MSNSLMRMPLPAPGITSFGQPKRAEELVSLISTQHCEGRAREESGDEFVKVCRVDQGDAVGESMAHAKEH